MNHCLLEVQVKKPPTIRYTQDNQTPIAEMDVLFDGLRADDPPGELKVVGWGNMAQELQSRIKTEQKLVIEGRLRMNTIPRQDGTKEKRAEFTLSKIHNLSINGGVEKDQDFPVPNQSGATSSSHKDPSSASANPTESNQDLVSWNSAPLVPDTDEIPF
tara:strand:- start:987 stop:1463 length:477 start_codon:yes stop_codon:yes gene_type:complete